jgi:23S rRNA (pseudouridine1915-N3)-methyltransferase
MNVKLICTGKTTDRIALDGMREYAGRIERYGKFSVVESEAGRGDDLQMKKKEGEILLKKLDPKDFLVLLDEKGKELTSFEFAEMLRHHQKIATKNLVFLIGGAYGFSEEVYKRANMKLALSKMTFPHQLVRVIFLEQLYRAFTIVKGEKYHH